MLFRSRAWLQAAWNEWALGAKRRPPAIDIRAARRAALHELLPQLTDTWCAVDTLCLQIKQGWPDIFRSDRTRLSTGWQTGWDEDDGHAAPEQEAPPMAKEAEPPPAFDEGFIAASGEPLFENTFTDPDRKSTRLNSSH